MIGKRCKHTKYKHSHQKNAKSEVKYLTRSSVPDTIFSNKQQATSNKQQATSNKQQATKRHKFPLRPNKFTIKHKQIYSHKKPQRPPSIELRSTSQSNNRHVLRIETIQSKKQDPWLLKTGFPKGCPLWQREYNQRSFEVKRGGHRGRETTTALT
ncbi:hypothetical protein HMPREF9721_00941 [Treponema denticola ATCC 35404]|nr:hypothetical protein HMPREF9721_00941 [Treponema denticola ATCC 35404]